jgi:CRISPR-associated Csx10 family RAMP protein
VDGVYTWDGYDQRPGRPDALHLARHTHTAINRARGVAEDGMLFTLETLEPGTLLRGCGWVEAADAPRVREALPQVRRMGRGTRRGRGQVAIELIDAEAQGQTAARVRALNARFQEAWDFYAALMGDAGPSPKPGTYFTLDLLAPAIFKDGVAATLVPPPLDLSIEVELVRRFAAPTLTEGWWQVAKLPYPTALAAQAGSVYLYRTLTPLSEEGIAALSAELDALRRRGIGEQRERGYGALLPCAPFHLWTAAQEAERWAIT